MMRITRRIVAGYVILAGLMGALAVFQILAIHRIQAVDRYLAQTDFNSALSSLHLISDRDRVEEYTRKAFAPGGSEHEARLKSALEDFESGLSRLKSVSLATADQEELNRLDKFWQTFVADLSHEQNAAKSYGPTECPASLQNDLERLRVQTDTVQQVLLNSLASAGERLKETGRNVELISWYALAIVFVLGTLTSVIIIRSISTPLARLSEGTRGISQGKDFFRLDTSRNDEFSQLAKDFNTLAGRLGNLETMKKAFVSHVSHDLKAPLASMRETLQLLLEEIPGPLTPKQKRLLDLNNQSLVRLSGMIGNLLDMSKIEAGIMEYEFTHQDLIPLIRTAIAEFDAMARERGLSLAIEFPDGPVWVDCDGNRITQVLLNIVGNAVKFSKAPGPIRIRCGLSTLPPGIPEVWHRMLQDYVDRSQVALVAVSDTGPGIPDEHKERVFQMFHQVYQGRKMAGQGVGLGLAVCRTIVEAHSGAIWVKDNESGGSEFFLLLQPVLEKSGIVSQQKVDASSM